MLLLTSWYLVRDLPNAACRIFEASMVSNALRGAFHTILASKMLTQRALLKGDTMLASKMRNAAVVQLPARYQVISSSMVESAIGDISTHPCGWCSRSSSEMIRNGSAARVSAVLSCPPIDAKGEQQGNVHKHIAQGVLKNTKQTIK